MVKLPKLDHVKYVKRKGAVYAYFNTGKKTAKGTTIYAPLPKPGSVGFFDSYAAMKGARTKRLAVEYTVAALVEEYLRSAALAEKAANTQKLYRSMAGKITEAWGKYPVDDLHPADVRLVLDNAGWNAGTRNMVLAVLGAIYTWARKNNKAAGWPTKDVDRAQGGEHDPWPEDILEAALASDDATIRLLTHLLYFTGLRINDALALRWGQVKDGVITVTPTKTARYRKTLYIPLAAELAEVLDKTPRRGIKIVDLEYRRARSLLQGFTANLGVKTVPHGLRKNAVIALLEHGCTVAETAAITGQTYQVVEHYAAQVNSRKLGKAAIVKFDAGRKKSA